MLYGDIQDFLYLIICQVFYSKINHLNAIETK
jgi:hypothetical protein